MRKCTYSDTIQGKKYEFMRISKKKARAAFNNNLPLIFCACNMRPGTPWHPEIIIDPQRQKEEHGREFDATVNNFEWYNCTLNETGKYTAFYIPVCCETFAGSNIPKRSQLDAARYDYDFIEAVR